MRRHLTPAELALCGALRDELAACHADMRAAVDGLPGHALDWRPRPDANSIAALVAHTLDAERFLVHSALDRRIERDRDSQFRVRGMTAPDLITSIETVDAEIGRLLDELVPGDVVKSVARQSTRTGAGWLVHAPVHSREHVGQLLLTRDLWLAQSTDER